MLQSLYIHDERYKWKPRMAMWSRKCKSGPGPSWRRHSYVAKQALIFFIAWFLILNDARKLDPRYQHIAPWTHIPHSYRFFLFFIIFLILIIVGALRSFFERNDMGRICFGWLAGHGSGFHLRSIPCLEGGVNLFRRFYFTFRYSTYHSHTPWAPKNLHFLNLWNFPTLARFFSFYVLNRLDWIETGSWELQREKRVTDWMLRRETGNISCLHDGNVWVS